jgi:superfamily II DNA or RNA helicase
MIFSGGKMEITATEVNLYEHNQKAYEAAKTMLANEGKAAVIHPTGTGKSFIAFKFAADSPDSRILWLGPSEYIYRTQLENLREGADKEEPAFANIRFMTYTRLMLEEDYIDTLQPDFIILDEFHRCGAALWGKSVEKLLLTYPGAKVLGLSATNVRYLDGQRDMAEEIFDGHVASEMSLGEAVGSGILPPPTYVLSMYSCGGELEKLEKKVSSIKNPVLRKENGEILSRLKRSLEKAEGLESIFNTYMEKNGKYIVFCSDREHMEEMLGHVHEWFSGVDAAPHVYRAYYDSPDTEREFDAFRKDDSPHLKLLYCIDMLNEGVHVKGVDGVVLLRPTVSPILYLQQVGRALSAGRDRHPVIFDIVNNFDSLYSIDSIRTEMEEAFCRMPGKEGRSRTLTEENFRIIDKVRECREIFGELEERLHASWDIYYDEARAYLNEHGDLKIPKNYITESGLNLWAWLMTQKKMRAGNAGRYGQLSAIRIRKLDELGMVWDSRTDESFGRGLSELEKYVNTKGSADVKARYVTKEGYALGKWVSYIRGCRESLSVEQTDALDRLGMIWSKADSRTERCIQAAEDYFKTHGNLNVPAKYVTEDGTGLGSWLGRLRKQAADGIPINSECRERLEKLGISWESGYDAAWNEKYGMACEYYRTNGHLNIPSHYMQGSVDIGKWIHNVRYKRRKLIGEGRDMKPERIRDLDKIGMVW